MTHDTRTFKQDTRKLQGTVAIPSDKSLSHRAVLFAAMAHGTSHLKGILDSADVRATIGAAKVLGATVNLFVAKDGSLEGEIEGWSPRTAPTSDEPLSIDCGNSGTTARLLLGVLGSLGIAALVDGDESLCKRPMARVTKPLESMGCRVELSDLDTLPAQVYCPENLHPEEISLQVASAQLKSAILLAGLQATGTTVVREPAESRNHTELLLPAFGVPVEAHSGYAAVTGPATLKATDFCVPGDPSSAAFLAVLAALTPYSDITISSISLNPTRTGFIEVMKRMGAAIEVSSQKNIGGEIVGNIRVRFSEQLTGCVVAEEEIPSLVDEVPILALFATFAKEPTRFCSVGELRVKESDRLAAIVDGLGKLGACAYVEGDDLIVKPGAPTTSAELPTYKDHRLAMTWAVAGMVGLGEVAVGDFSCIDVSFPTFEDVVASVRYIS